MGAMKASVVVILSLVLFAGSATAACKGKLNGAASGEFACSVDANYREKKDSTALVIGVPTLPAGVGSMAPCSFYLKGKPAVGKYTLKELGQGGALLTTADGRNFVASGAAGKGSLTLDLQKVEPEGKRRFTLTGKLTATLEEIGGAGRVQVEVSF
jgi:hypothetical protein